MALDFHIAKTQKDAPYKNPVASISMETHSEIFSSKEAKASSIGMLNKLSDYYCDAKYDLKELPALVQALEQLKAYYSKGSKTHTEIESILSACNRALQEECSIWVYCD